MAKLKDLKVTIGLSKRGLSKLNADLRRTKGNFKRNFGEIAALAGSLATAIGTSLVAGVGVLVKKGAELQKLKVGFRSIMGGADEAAAMVDKLNKFTASTPFRLEEVSRSARQLIAVGVGVDDVTDRMRMLGDIAAASGNNISDIAAIFAKVQAKGKVELENLNQLAERGIPIFDQLRTVTGDVNMEFGAGSVQVSEFNEALEQMAAEGGFANDAMVNLSETVDGRFSTALDNISLALGEFAEKSGLLDAISNQLDDFTSQIQRMSMTDADLVKSREEVYDITVKLRSAHKGNIEALQQEADAAYETAKAVNAALGTEASKRHFEGATAMYDRVTEAMAFASTSLSTLPEAPAGYGEAASGTSDDEVKTKKEMVAMERSHLLELGKVKEMHGVMAVDILAAVEANHHLKGSMQEVSAVAISTTDTMAALGSYAAQHLPGLMNQAFASIVAGAGQFKDFMLDMLKQILIKLASMVAAFAALSIFFPGSQAVKGGLGKFMAGGFGIPQMAEGGLFTGASLAMVGEGAGTSMINPEVVAPLDKLQQMMGGGAVTVTGRLDGRDILLSSERAGFDRNRVRGF